MRSWGWRQVPVVGGQEGDAVAALDIGGGGVEARPAIVLKRCTRARVCLGGSRGEQLAASHSQSNHDRQTRLHLYLSIFTC